jgi:hypothetical protein
MKTNNVKNSYNRRRIERKRHKWLTIVKSAILSRKLTQKPINHLG